MSEMLKEDRAISFIVLLEGIILLSVTIIINLFFMPLIGFYFVSFFSLAMGSSFFFPPKGRKISENCYVMIYHIDDFIVTLNDHKLLISGERLKGKYDHIIYKENMPKWLPPHEEEPVSDKDYKFILDAVLKFLAKQRRRGVIQGSNEDIEPSFTKEDIINGYARKGWKTENLPDGSAKVSPRKKKNLIMRVFKLFSTK